MFRDPKLPKGMLTKGVVDRVREAEMTPRQEVEGTKAEAMATKATKRAMMNFMVLELMGEG